MMSLSDVRERFVWLQVYIVFDSTGFIYWIIMQMRSQLKNHQTILGHRSVYLRSDLWPNNPYPAQIWKRSVKQVRSKIPG